MVERNLLLYTTLFFLAVACGRGVSENSSSSIVIRTPSSIASSGVGAMAAIPAGRAACYGINILGVGSSHGDSCSPPTGILAGFVSAGDTVTAQVPSKSNVKIQLFMYLKAVGSSDPCPALLPFIPAEQLDDVYMVGETSNVYVDGANMAVTINGTFPGVSQNIAQTFSIPSSCIASNSAGPTSFSVSAGAQTMTGAGFSMTARAGKPMNQTLTGAGFKLIVR